MSETSPHDPGPEAAGDRGERHATAAREPLTIGGATVRIGTASWTDPTMTAPGVFYPPDASTAEDRLVYYANQFPIVEVDATYYALPVRRQGELWLERTPPDFTFDIKAHALMTGQPSEPKRLPEGPARGAPGRDRRAEARLRARPAERDRGRDLGALPRRDRAAPQLRQARRGVPPVPALVLPLERVARRDREGEGAPRRHAVRRRASPRIVAERQEPRADASASSRSTRSRSSWSTRRPARARRCRR